MNVNAMQLCKEGRFCFRAPAASPLSSEKKKKIQARKSLTRNRYMKKWYTTMIHQRQPRGTGYLHGPMSPQLFIPTDHEYPPHAVRSWAARNRLLQRLPQECVHVLRAVRIALPEH